MVSAAPVSAAEDCTLKMVTAIDTISTSSGGMLVPVTLSGTKRKLLLDTGGYFSEISPQVADEMNLPRRHVGLTQYDAAGHGVEEAVTVDGVSIGNLKGSAVKFMVGSPGLGGDGTLAPDILKAYDVELDFPTISSASSLPIIAKAKSSIGRLLRWRPCRCA